MWFLQARCGPLITIINHNHNGCNVGTFIPGYSWVVKISLTLLTYLLVLASAFTRGGAPPPRDWGDEISVNEEDGEKLLSTPSPTSS